MLKHYCTVCPDARKFEMKVNDLRQTNMRLERSIMKYKVRETENNLLKYLQDKKIDVRSIMYLKNRVPNTHFMCGSTCRKVSKRDLDRVYQDLYLNYLKLVYILLETQSEEEFRKIKHNLLAQFRGVTLSAFYRHLERIRFSEIKE